MLALNRISRLRSPRSNLASTALLVITFSVFAVIAHFAVEQQRTGAEVVRESPPAAAKAEQLDLWSLLHHLRF
ncbi:MAG: hypothetical protein EA417_02645 [Gammaproteobacteria bacterium]|nr:MAG: hypothetical protein EA417_02645 [Gammaproteobacteria bacterium]